MKILVAADLHGAHDTYSWLVDVAAARTPDALVLAGDLLGHPPGFPSVEKSQAHDARQVLGILKNIRCPVLYIMGNDDLVELGSESGRIRSIHARREDLGPFNFVGYQYSLPFMGGVFEKEEAEIAEDLRQLASLIDEQTVLVTHSPAYRILDVGILDRHAGSRSILELIEERQPRVHLHGHIHGCVGRQGRHWNVGTYECRRAVLIDLETLEDEVLEAA